MHLIEVTAKLASPVLFTNPIHFDGVAWGAQRGAPSIIIANGFGLGVYAASAAIWPITAEEYSNHGDYGLEADAITFYVVGNRRRLVKSIAKPIPSDLGDGTDRGYGQVGEWTFEVLDQDDLSPVFFDNGLTQRDLPREWVIGAERTRSARRLMPPYFAEKDRHEVVPAFANCEDLKPEIHDALRRIRSLKTERPPRAGKPERRKHDL